MPLNLARTRNMRALQRGLSIVEMMVGVAVGLFVVAGAAMVVAGQLASNRLLLLDMQLQQDLRAAADIVSREIRRTGAMQDGGATLTLWWPGMTGLPVPNYAAQALTPANGTQSSAFYQYQRLQGITNYEFRLEGTRLQSWLARSRAWQDLTDPNVMEITNFAITTRNGPAVVVPCPYDCAGGGQACWPTVRMRDVQIVIDARSATDPTVVRSIRSNVQLRADLIAQDPAFVLGICPPVP